jgi:probable HAF family extracellular repeat protein
VLPTIGDDPDGVAFAINDAGLVAVSTGRCNEPGLNHMYVWDHGVIRRISDFGGTGNDVPQAINALGQVIGCAALAGQNVLVHPFLWSRGVTTDLGTLPGDVSSCAYGINERTQIVGESDDASGFPHPYLWQNGKMVDLNEFVSQTSPLLLLVATWINDKGWITGLGLQPTGAIHPFLAIPTVGTSSVQGALRTQEMQSRYKGTSLASFVPLRLRAMFSGARGVSSMKPTR